MNCNKDKKRSRFNNINLVIYHGLAKMQSNRGERGVVIIIISPTTVEAYKANYEERTLTSSSGSDIDSGRFTSINVKLNGRFKIKSGALRKNKTKNFILNITLASIYY